MPQIINSRYQFWLLGPMFVSWGLLGPMVGSWGLLGARVLSGDPDLDAEPHIFTAGFGPARGSDTQRVGGIGMPGEGGILGGGNHSSSLLKSNLRLTAHPGGCCGGSNNYATAAGPNTNFNKAGFKVNQLRV